MRRALLLILAFAALGAGYFLATRPKPPPPAPVASAALEDVGPRLVSNQTSYPLYLYGRDLRAGDVAVFSGAFSLRLPTAFVDAGHLALRLPPQRLAPQVERAQATVTLERDGKPLPGQATLTLVNDAAFAEPYACALTPAGDALFVASPTTDEVARYETATGARSPVPAGDGPRALAVTADGGTLVVAEEWGEDLRLVDLRGGPARTVALGGRPQDLWLEGGTAWVTLRQEELLSVDLARGEVTSRKRVPGRQPRSVVRAPGGAFVAELGTDDLAWLGDDGKVERVAPGPGTPIVGGATEKLSAYLMGGKAPRALAIDPRRGLLFQSSIGPNVGPNPQRAEVSMNSGVGLVSLADRRFLLHRGLGQGVLEGLAIDPERGLLFAADTGAGKVIAFSEDKLRDDPAHALLGELAIAPPEGTPRIRPAADFGGPRAGVEVHSGPRALCLDAKARRLYAVNRLSGTVSVVDVSKPEALALAQTFAGPEMWNQKERRLGDVLYLTDLGRTAMSCDACHLEGHTSGVLYEKTHPLRIYRVSTLRAIRDSAPYFTPSALPTLEVVAHDVLARNRFQNPVPSADEVRWLATYQADLAPPPNPNVGPDGAPQAKLTLPDGRSGDPRAGLAVFQKAGCGAAVCHPSPQFTADQDGRTRGRFQDVGTPVILPLRPEFQEPVWNGWPPPPLVGAWDVFPMMQSGAGGLSVAPDGRVVPDRPFALRAVLEWKGGKPHGKAGELSEAERDDLLAYLLSI